MLTDEEKDNFTMKCTVTAALFEDSFSGVIPVVVVKINIMVESQSAHMEVIFFLLIFFNNDCIIK